MLEKSYDIPLHDIKTIVEVQEYSLYYFIGISLIILVLICIVIFYLYRWFKNKNTYNQRKEYIKILSALDFSDTKKSAYAITFFGALFKDDSQKHTQIYEDMILNLELYKYKKDVDKFDEIIILNVKSYLEIIDV